MARLLTASVVLVTAVGATAPAAPVQEDADRPVVFFPTVRGTRWVVTQQFVGPSDQTEVVTAVRWRGREAVVSVAYETDGKLVPARTLLVSADGVFTAAREDGGRIDPLRPWLKSPLVPGTSWDVTVRDYQLRATVRGREEVAVPAGKYQAVRVDSEARRKSGQVYRLSEWHAEGVGRVKVEMDGQTVEVLKSFTPGKD